MSETHEFCPIFARPPVVETSISVQFKPLSGIRAAHFGLFWQDCLGLVDWIPSDDQTLIRHEIERFDSALLNPPAEDLGEIDSLALRAVFRSRDDRSTIHFQPDRLVYTYARQGSPRPSFTDMRKHFDPLYTRFEKFSRDNEFGEIQPDLWEVVYTNAIPRGELWANPSDWHRVLPGLFPTVPPLVQSHEWSTFEGEWYFTMPQQAGRVRVKVSKAVANQTGEVVLLLVIRARGSLGSGSPRTWAEGLELGHRSAVSVFYDIASPEARATWGVNNDHN